MPRQPRKRSATETYHVMARGIDRLPIFSQPREKNRILSLIRENQEEYDVQIYAYCIMSNHFHLLIHAKLDKLASFMAKILAGYATYYNYKHNRSGYVFESRFKSQCVEKESYYWNCLRYIHINPVKANLAQDMLQYTYCSITEYYSEQKKGYAILHENAFVSVKRRFAKLQEFFSFHQLNSREIFIDTSEEELLQKKEVAKDILYSMHYELKLPVEEIFDYIKVRNMLDKSIMDTMKTSLSEAKSLRKLLQSEIGTG